MAGSQTININDIYTEQYGMDTASKDTMRNYGYALLVIAGADGDVADSEREWLISSARAYGTPDDVLQAYRDFDHRSARLEDLAQTVDAQTGAIASNTKLIYDAINICGADGVYSHRERAKVLRAAAILRVSDDVVFQLHALVELEHGLNKMRKAIFHTDSLPR